MKPRILSLVKIYSVIQGPCIEHEWGHVFRLAGFSVKPCDRKLKFREVLFKDQRE